jgi:hypothetical protein
MVSRRPENEDWVDERFLPKKRLPRNGQLLAGKSVTFSKEIEKTSEAVGCDPYMDSTSTTSVKVGQLEGSYG